MSNTSDTAAQDIDSLDDKQLALSLFNNAINGRTKKIVFSNSKWEVVHDNGWALRQLLDVDDDPDPQEPLNEMDALSYLVAVKTKLKNRPDLYYRFLQIMKRSSYGMTNTIDLIESVIPLFKRHDILVLRLNTFLPAAYHIRRKVCEQSEEDLLEDLQEMADPPSSILRAEEVDGET